MFSVSSYVSLCAGITAFKFLFLPLYFSTDFDVHRNWLAITFNLPMNRWYFDDTSQWTLDYPPLFAWFEYSLATFANIVDPGMLKLTSGTIRTYTAIVFQRTSVILSDIFYYYAIYELCIVMEQTNFWCNKKNQIRHTHTHPDPISLNEEGDVDANVESDDEIENYDDYALINRFQFHRAEDNENERRRNLQRKKFLQNFLDALLRPDVASSCALLLLLHPSLLIVDHVHFQYNGFLSAFLLISLARLVKRSYIEASIWFAVLLNLKHIYLYCAPAFGIYLLRKYCLGSQNRFTGFDFIIRLHLITLAVEIVFIITFMPFMQAKSSLLPPTSPIPRGLMQILSRLFPFKRGLCHAYWAPNFWAIYNTIDKLCSVVIKKVFHFSATIADQAPKAIMTGGLVQDFSHEFLPTIKPLATFIAVASIDLPIVIKLWNHWTNPNNNVNNKQSSRLFLRSLTLCAFTAFQFGYHVHEKAIILVLLPLIPLSFLNLRLSKCFIIISVAGTYGLFPLLYEPGEWPIKILLSVIYHFYALKILQQHQNLHSKTHSRIMDPIINLYFFGFVVLELYCTCLHGKSFNPISVLNKLEFLPLLLTSLYSSVGILYGYIITYSEMMQSTCLVTN